MKHQTACYGMIAASLALLAVYGVWGHASFPFNRIIHDTSYPLSYYFSRMDHLVYLLETCLLAGAAV